MAKAKKDSGRVFNAEEVLAQRLFTALALAGVNASTSHAEKIATAIRQLVEAVVEAQEVAK